jgi:hypothetical protein
MTFKLLFVGHVARKEAMRNAYKFLSENLRRRYLLDDVGLFGKIILERILVKEGGKLWIRFIWLKTGPSGGLS